MSDDTLYTNPYAEFPYVHPSWRDAKGKPHSKMVFKAEKDTRDDDEIAALASTAVIEDIPPEELRKARRSNTLESVILKYTKRDDHMSLKRALILHQCKRVEGKVFTIPKAWTNHPLAGQTPPLDAELVASIKSEMANDIVEALNEQYRTRSADEEDSFPGDDSGDVGDEHQPADRS